MKQVADGVIVAHCHTHCVNLAVRDAVKSNPILRDFLHLMQEMITFLRDSPKRSAIVRNVAQSLDCPQNQIRPLCPTRFTVKYNALHYFESQLEVVGDTLQEITDCSNDSKVASTCSGFVKRMWQFDFFFSLKLSTFLFEVTDRLSSALQNPSISVGQSTKLVGHAVNELSNHRDRFDNFWDDVE